MKKLYLLLFLLIAANSIWAQTTETFETEPSGSTSFTDNGQIFNITSQQGGPFDIQTNFPGTGWNGTAPDNKHIDNDTFAGFSNNCEFTVAGQGGATFTLKSLWLFLSDYNLDLNVAGTLTITGKLAGATVFTASSSPGFNNTNSVVNNGFTFINMSTFGGANNSSTTIDSFVIRATEPFNYVSLDAMTWQTACVAPSITANPPSRTICAGGNTTFTVAATNATGYQWQVNTGSGFTNVTNAAPYSGATTATLTITGAVAPMSGYTYRVIALGSCLPYATSNNGSLTVSSINTSNASQSNVSCFGGSNGVATVIPSGGVAPYTYSWAPSGGTNATASGLAAGTYTVTVTDNIGCTATKTFTITEPATVLSAIAGTVNNVSCNGGANGTATVIASGGTPGYTYLWSPSGGTSATATGLVAGTYTVTVTDANSCQTTQSFTITEPTAISLLPSQTNVSCNGGLNGTATVTASGGIGAYIYSWSPSGGTAATASGLAVGTYTVTVTDANNCQATQSFTITQPSFLTASTVQTNIACYGGATGAISVYPTGGTPGYTYLWSPSGGTNATATGLVAGTYTVTITDANGCTATRNFSLWESPQLTATTTQTNVSCNSGANGTATVTVSGGAAPYTYSWAPFGGTNATASGLTAGTYTITITDTYGCQITEDVTITEPTPISIVPSQTDSSCSGGANGTATATVTGGTAPYTYSWSPSGGTAATASGLAAGTYTVTVTDANTCQATQTYTIIESSSLNAVPLAQTNIACNGGATGSATVSATGGTGPYTYSWAPSGGTAATATGLTAGTYTVTVTDANNCTDTQSFTITQPTSLNAVPIVQTNIACNGGATGSATVTATGGTGSYTYSWSPSGGTAATATGLTAGTYTVTITDANGCIDIQSFTITQLSPLTATTTQTNVSCNGGANGTATVAVSGGAAPYTYSWAPSGGTNATASGLTAGTYTVTITDTYDCQITEDVTITEQNPISIAPSQTNVSCFGGTNGTATATVTGGTAPYTYSWSPSGGTAATASGLAPGTYTVTVTDANGCTDTQTYTITQPASALAVPTSIINNIACYSANTGSLVPQPTGGTPPYTYSWSDGPTTQIRIGLVAGNYTVVITDANGCTVTRNYTITQQSQVVSTGTQTNVTCPGGSNGSATVNVSGGTGSYIYTWQPTGGNGPTATGLSAGNYTVIINDTFGCYASRNFTITEPSPITITTTQTDVSCNGGANGTATVNVTGGTGAYTYSWAPSGGTAATATGLTAGTYTVTVTDANGCTNTQVVTIIEPTSLVATTSQTNVSCNGGANGTATVTATGGTGAYTYSWAPSGGTAATATELTAGTYTVTVTDANGCTNTQVVTIIEPTSLVATTLQTNVSCNGGANGTATATATGGTGTYTYAWAPSGGTAATATGLAAGTYTVTVTDANGCTFTQNVTITQPAALVASAGTQTNVSCNGGANGSATVNVTGGTGAYAYAWAPSGGTAATASGLTAGTYTVTVTDANACTDTQSFTITQPDALAATTSQVNVSCNADTNGMATVTVTGGVPTYTYSWNTTPVQTTATATGLAAGTYTVTVTDANGCTLTRDFTLTQPTVLNAVAGTQVNVLCNGNATGSATVTVTGGTAGYTYSWNTTPVQTTATATALAAGTYTVTVTDANGCTDTQNFTITQPLALDLTLTTTNVSCPGYNDGTATATVTGGVTPYIYSWDTTPAQTTATASNLTDGEYTVTVTDANGCTITETITVNTTPDVTPAVPNMANLPTITNYCQVLEDEILVPTATDACNGEITAVTSDLLNYSTTGNYTITWAYNDGNGNTSTQTQTIVVEDSPLDEVTFNDAVFTYNEAVQSITVNNLPAGATVNYSIIPATGTDNGAVNAGTYTVTAELTPPAEAFNCDPVTLTATITIEKAPQFITFNPIPIKNLEADPDFQLDATASSGLEVYYTYTFTAPQAPATVTPEGFVDMLTSGEVMITAHQDGDDNWLPAESVEQMLIIESSNASISTISIGDETYNTPAQEIYHLIDCGDTSESVDVTIVTEVNAQVTPGHQFTIQTPVPGIYTEEVTVISQDGTVTLTYTIVVEKRFNFHDIVVQKFDNVLLVNNNPQTNGGYEFVSYEWFRNGQMIGTGQYYSAGNDASNLLDPASEYYVRMTTVQGDVLQTCITQIVLEHQNAGRLYPNPVETGGRITIEADFPAIELKDMQISIYTLDGKLLKTLKSSAATTHIEMPVEAAMYLVVLETPNNRKTFKVIVDKK